MWAARVVAVFAAWVPLAVLAGGQAVAGSPGAASSFFTDFATYGRLLLAVPALILAEPDCLPWLRRIVRAFVDEGFVQGHDLARFEAARASARRLLDSRLAEALTIVMAYAIVIALMIYVPAAELPAWARSTDARITGLSLAGWWNALVSLPILLVLLLGWFWRVVLWARFLTQVAALDLRLIPAHPDRMGGLRFISTSLEGFRLVSMAMGTMVAGPPPTRSSTTARRRPFRGMALGLLIASDPVRRSAGGTSGASVRRDATACSLRRASQHRRRRVRGALSGRAPGRRRPVRADFFHDGFYRSLPTSSTCAACLWLRDLTGPWAARRCLSWGRLSRFR